MSKTTAICVLGMHRSGTSIATRLISAHGVYLGEECELLPPMPDNNPEGFWERKDVYAFSDALLKKFNMSWDTVLPLPEEWSLIPDAASFEDQLTAILQKNLLSKPMWGWKDPRTMLLLPLWRKVLDKLGVPIHVIYMIRNPLDVALSLNKRDSLSINKGMGIWVNYNVSALRSLRGLPVSFVTYEKLLADAANELRRCERELKIEWPVKTSSVSDDLGSLVRKDLCHSLSSIEKLKKLTPPPFVIELYEFLVSMSEGRRTPDPSTSPLVNNIYRNLSEYSLFTRDDLELLDRSRALILAEQKKLSASGTDKVQIIEDKRPSCSSSSQRMMEDKIVFLNGELENTKKELAHLREVYDLSQKEKDLEIQSYINSYSWRITGPLRWLHGLLFQARRTR